MLTKGGKFILLGNQRFSRAVLIAVACAALLLLALHRRVTRRHRQGAAYPPPPYALRAPACHWGFRRLWVDGYGYQWWMRAHHYIARNSWSDNLQFR